MKKHWRTLWSSLSINYRTEGLTFNDQIQVSKIYSNHSGGWLRFHLSNQFSEYPVEIETIFVSNNRTQETVRLTGNFILEKGAEKVLLVAPLSVVCGDEIKIIAYIKKAFQLTTLGYSMSAQWMKSQFLQPSHQGSKDSQQSFFHCLFFEVEILTEAPVTTLTFFGDSLTHQGFIVSALSEKLYHLFPNQISVRNAGISGNRLLHDAHSTSSHESTFGPAGLTRLASSLQSVDTPEIVIFLMGINDLIHPGNGSPIHELPDAKTLIAGIEKAQKIVSNLNKGFVPCTLMPFKGYYSSGNFAWTQQLENIRQEVNQYIRSYPSYLDYDLAVKNSEYPEYLKPYLDIGDSLHLSDNGGKAIANDTIIELEKIILHFRHKKNK